MKEKIPRSKEWCKKISLAKRGKPLPPFSEEHRRKIGLANKRRKMSAEGKSKISKANKGKIPWNYGLPQSKEVKDKISKSLYGRFRGKQSPNWSGGRKKGRKYISILSPKHPFSHKSGYIYEHRLVMEKKIGRYLNSAEVVHHIDRNTFNNHPSNLQLFSNQFNHAIFHSSLKS